MAAARGDRIDLLGTGRAIDARTAARKAAESGAERVIAIGGDGTVVEAAAGLLALSDPPPLAIVPQGTANLLALNLGVPHDRESAIQAAFSSEVGRIDCGRANGEPFLIAVGAGVHADVIARADRSSKRRWGVAAYGIAGWHATRGVTPVRFTIEIDGEEIEIEATTVQVMNVASVIRRGWEFAHGVSPVDGILDVVAHRASTLAEHIVDRRRSGPRSADRYRPGRPPARAAGTGRRRSAGDRSARRRDIGADAGRDRHPSSGAAGRPSRGQPMDVVSERIALAALLAAWAIGAAFFPLGGMIHFLLILAIILFLAGRFGRQE